MAVDGVDVSLVPGWQVADRRPLREDPLPEAGAIKGLQNRDLGITRTQKYQKI